MHNIRSLGVFLRDDRSRAAIRNVLTVTLINQRRTETLVQQRSRLGIDRPADSPLPGPEEVARRDKSDESGPSGEIERAPSGSGAAVYAGLSDADDLQVATSQQIVNASFVALLQDVFARQQQRIQLAVGVP